ncbi:MAG: hypothetical protein M3137_13395 [Actinomycetota bacterium]|nr:hypothetical protein [Actinomycetota bacterium]
MTNERVPDPVPSRWLSRLLAATGWIELWGWQVVAAIIPWAIVAAMVGIALAMLGVVPWKGPAPLLGAGGVMGIWRRIRQLHQLSPPQPP